MNNYQERALELSQKQYTVIPLTGKAPTILDWQNLRSVTPDQIDKWARGGLWRNIGMVCGEASKNIVVIDFDGMRGYELFSAQFPDLANTFTVKTGSGNGMHCYYQVDLLPDSKGWMKIDFDGDGTHCNIEFKANGKQVVIPPSIHPDTGKPYEVFKKVEILKLTDMSRIEQWANTFTLVQDWKPPARSLSNGGDPLNPKLLSAVESHFLSQPHKIHGDWINCSCPNSGMHAHGDKVYSFGYNTRTAIGNCYRCGSMLLKAVCEHINIVPSDYGGIFEPRPPSLNGNGHGTPDYRPQIQQAVDTPAPEWGDAIPVVTRSSMLTSFVERLSELDENNVAPIPFPFEGLHQYGGMAKIIKPGKLIGIVGISGGGKTSLLESLVDRWLALRVSCLVWSPEWDAEELVDRAVQRYSGVAVEDIDQHRIWLDEKAHGVQNGFGKKLSREQYDNIMGGVQALRGWKDEVGYLDMPYLTSGYLQMSLANTLKSLTFKPRVLIIDYAQLLHALEPDSDLTMYTMLLRIKALCKSHGLVGVIATQVTKDSARGQKNGAALDSMAARYVNDDAFNLFLTINPDHDTVNGGFLPHAVINVAKNSMGRRGKVRLGVNWSRLYFDHKPHMNQNFDEEK